MPRKLADTRQPKSEAEEADWHATPEGRRITQREFARALRDGTLSRSPGLDHPKTRRNVLEQLLEQARQNASRAISIRIPIADLEHAKRIAERTGVGYQTGPQAGHPRGSQEGRLIDPGSLAQSGRGRRSVP